MLRLQRRLRNRLQVHLAGGIGAGQRRGKNFAFHHGPREHLASWPLRAASALTSPLPSWGVGQGEAGRFLLQFLSLCGLSLCVLQSPKRLESL